MEEENFNKVKEIQDEIFSLVERLFIVKASKMLLFRTPREKGIAVVGKEFQKYQKDYVLHLEAEIALKKAELKKL